MSKSGLFNKKFIIIAISILVIIAIVVGCVFIFRPKVDLSAPYNDTYSLVYDEDYNYVIERDEAVYDTLSSLTNVSSEDYQSTVQSFRDINILIQTITDNNTFILENLLFTEDKDGNMLALQQDLSETRDDITDKIEDCKNYIDQYLTDSAINQYPDDDATFRYVQNYYTYYISFATSLTSYYRLLSDVVENYLVDTFAINPLTKYNIKSLNYWADSICQYYSTLEVEQSTLSSSIENLVRFENSIILDDKTYIQNTSDYDELLSNFSVLDFNSVIDNLAKNTFDDYIASLEGELSTSAETLKNNYFLV